MATLELRLRACDPCVQDSGDRSYKRRFNNILHPLKDWVHTDSKITTDFTVDKGTLQEMGFSHVAQSTFSDQNARNFTSNYHVMEYLRKIVPRMFQNTLSLLSRQMIQQFLDELVWREMYGTTAARAFDNIILHIAEQTRIDSPDNNNLLDRLAKIAANPFQDWSYSNINPPALTTSLGANNKEQQSQQRGPDTATGSGAKQAQIPPVQPTSATTAKKNRKRGGAAPVISPHSSVFDESTEPVSKKNNTPCVGIEPKAVINRECRGDGRDNGREKESERDGAKTDQIQLQEFYYATMEGSVDKALTTKEAKTSLYFKCFLCSNAMRSNTEVMEHMIAHVPPQVPGQSESPVCRYCCTAFSSRHQMLTHVTEAHSNFGHSDSDMVACAICEQKFGSDTLLVNHLSSMHYPSEMPYRCEACGYRTSSHKDGIDHFYIVHERGEGLQCPYCLKVIPFVTEGSGPSASGAHAFLLHMQRHVIRREQGRGNKCSRCCLWFNQKSSLRTHQKELHDCVSGARVKPYSGGNGNGIMITKQRALLPNRRFDTDNTPAVTSAELSRIEKVKRWSTGPIVINSPAENLSCQECEEDITEEDHYPGEQRCQQCRYVTCCWRAFKEHQQQIHNERPMTSLIVPSPLINIPLERRMRCPCGFATIDGNLLATHLVKCKKVCVYPVENAAVPSGMLDSLGLVPKSSSEHTEETMAADGFGTNSGDSG